MLATGYGNTKKFMLNGYSALTEDSSAVYSIGDMDGNSAVDATDVSTILTAYAYASVGKDVGLTDEQREFTDVNKDGKVDVSDTSTVLTYYAHSSTDFEGSFIEYLDIKTY